jgi:hypothetical protein
MPDDLSTIGLLGDMTLAYNRLAVQLAQLQTVTRTLQAQLAHVPVTVAEERADAYQHGFEVGYKCWIRGSLAWVLEQQHLIADHPGEYSAWSVISALAKDLDQRLVALGDDEDAETPVG